MSELVRCYNGAKMTDENNNERLVAQEMVRLSEARLDVQQAEVSVVERKAALLGAFCFAVIAYLLAHNAELFWALAKNKEDCRVLIAIVVFVAKVIPSAFLATGVIFCWRTLMPTGYQWKGISLADMAVNPFEYDLTAILKGLAKRYDEAVQKNNATIREKKAENIHQAITWGALGVILSLVSVLLGEIAIPVIFAAC